eukprot:CAMPEP_0118881472 /NCGR_PEP_ID=MMETSP1163-20130328/20943_1 /TAXON_ID=124430 /ORGANISM="Phaeomonas parva, Strain CCMP2877" /LENGTH=76 /DNA_ID=CAMNT_0006818265 /DNA_START=187 /DNA_END=415 /DNA_ORIENTATION=+
MARARASALGFGLASAPEEPSAMGPGSRAWVGVASGRGWLGLRLRLGARGPRARAPLRVVVREELADVRQREGPED